MALSLREPGYYSTPFDARPLPPSVDNAGVGRVYAALSPVYDVVFGAPLQAGRVAAVAALDIRPGDHVLEVGTGTGLTAPLYPRDCRVTAVDLSAAMLARAQARLARARLTHVGLLAGDAARLAFPDASFDCVHAPHVVSVVPDPVRVVREMQRVCRPGGRIVLLNHFRSGCGLLASVERSISPLTRRTGFRSDVDLPALVDATGLRVTGLQSVNWPPIWTVVTCVRD